MCENEFKAIVLAAGGGSRMRDITNHKPKCLLPVGNLPVIWFPLSMLERAGFSAVTVIVLEEEQSEIKRTLDKLDLHLSFKFVSIKQEDDLGTTDALRKIPRIGEESRDVVIVSCDLVTQHPLSNLLNDFRRHEAAVAALFFPCVPDPVPGSTPGPKSKQKPERDLVGLDPVTSRLVFLASASDFEESVDVRMRVLRKYKRVELHSRLSDAHLYVVSKHLWPYLVSDDNCGLSLKAEVLPYLVKQQLSSHNKQQCDTKRQLSDRKMALFQHVARDELQFLVEKLSTWSDHSNLEDAAYHGDVLRCFGLVTPTEEVSVRVNTLHTYCHLNRQVVRPEIWSSLTAGRKLERVPPSCTVKSKKMDACILGSNTQVAEGAKLERCCVGSHCVIEANVSMSDCILMDNVTIEQGAVLSNCLVCERGVVQKNAVLKSCLVGNNYQVSAQSSHENEILSAVVMET